MKKFLLSSTVVILFALYVYKTFGTQTLTPPTPNSTGSDLSSNTQQEATTDTTLSTDDRDADVDIPRPTTSTTDNSAPTQTTPANTQSQPTATTKPAQTNSQPAANTKPATPTAPKSIYKDGTFTGPAVDAYYGTMQVQVVVSGGKITDVNFLQYPNDQRNSIRINSYAMPIFKQEIIAAQSANVNAVSGASASSPATIESLKGALALARN